MNREYRRLSTPPQSRQKLAIARDHFADLLHSDTTERDWQSFFDANPFVLADTLPVHFDALYKHVPLLTGVPDYVFNTMSGTPGLGDWGVIELKRPDDAIIGTYTSRVLLPSRKLAAAHQQIKQYLYAIEQGQFLQPGDAFAVGNRRHAFIIMGLSSEIRKKCNKDHLREAFCHLLPMGFHLFTYDEVCDVFSARVGRPVVVLVAQPHRLRVIWASEDRECTGRLVPEVFKVVAGWEVIHVTHGKQVVPAWRSRSSVDAILLHHNYLRSDGWRLSRIVEEIARNGARVPTIVLNTNIREDCEALLGHGVHHMIDLPCDIRVLLDEILNAVAEYSATVSQSKRRAEH
ncbi:MAG: DUF4263 domain-containing protein [Candidatus Coatesbacteria bacterium]|nr:DUF4263 domain-containing protein [Candidatus Coatesbacteria bacterium]